VFEVVTRYLNFRLAAEEIGVTQGAVTGQGLAVTSRFCVEDDLRCKHLVRALRTVLRAGSDFHILPPRRPRHRASVGGQNIARIQPDRTLAR
jgi:DNA-binding transcriptional LysR family regulator